MLVLFILVLLGCGYMQTATSLESDVTPCYYGLLGSEKGVITSYNYPFKYRNHLNCTQRIYLDHTPPHLHNTVCLTFHRFALEGCLSHIYDSLTLVDEEAGTYRYRYCARGESYHNDTLQVPGQLSQVWPAQFCWKLPPGRKYFSLNFNTDVSVVSMGFYATYHVFDDSQVTPRHVHKPSSDGGPLVPYNCADIDNCRPYCYHGSQLDGHGCRTCNCTYPGAAPCSTSQWTCFNRECIDKKLWCDGTVDCSDGSDESYFHAGCVSAMSVSRMHACDFTDSSRCGISLDSLFKVGTHYSTRYCSPENAKTRHQYGPCFDHTGGPYHGTDTVQHGFLVTDFSQNTSRAYFHDSLPYDVPAVPHCLSFWYHMSGNDVGALYVHLLDSYSVPGSDMRPVWSRVGNYSNRWLYGQFPFIPQSNTKIRFEARRGGRVDSRIAVDDISIIEGACIGDDRSCNFEGDSCDWFLPSANSSCSVCWRVTQAQTSSNTLPYNDYSSFDRAGGYIYMGTALDNIQLSANDYFLSRAIFTTSGNSRRCITYWYNKQGSGVGHIAVKYKLSNGRTEYIVYHINRNTGTTWKLFQRTVTSIGPFQIKIEGNVEQGPLHLAIDQISVVTGFCKDISLGMCGNGEFRCYSNGACIDAKDVCDDTSDCVDGSDEDWRAGCKTQCHDSEYTCNDGSCVPEYDRCDGTVSCPDGSDEQGCRTGGYANVNTPVIVGLTIAIGIVLLILSIRMLICIKSGQCSQCLRKNRRLLRRRCIRCRRRCCCRRCRPNEQNPDDSDAWNDGPEPDPRWFEDPPGYDDCCDNPAYLPKKRIDNNSIKTLPPSYQSFRKKGYKEISVQDAVKIMTDWHSKKVKGTHDKTVSVTFEDNGAKVDDVYVISSGVLDEVAQRSQTSARNMPDIVPDRDRQNNLQVDIHEPTDTAESNTQSSADVDSQSLHETAKSSINSTVIEHGNATDVHMSSCSYDNPSFQADIPGMEEHSISADTQVPSEAPVPSSSTAAETRNDSDTCRNKLSYDNPAFQLDLQENEDGFPTSTKNVDQLNQTTEQRTLDGTVHDHNPNDQHPGLILNAQSKSSPIPPPRRSKMPNVCEDRHPSRLCNAKFVVVDVLPEDNTVACQNTASDSVSAAAASSASTSADATADAAVPKMPAGLVYRRNQKLTISEKTDNKNASSLKECENF